MSELLMLYPPVLPFGYTLHHRFAKFWEATEHIRSTGRSVTAMDAGLLNYLLGNVVSEFACQHEAVAMYCDPPMISTVLDLAERCRAVSPSTRILVYGTGAVCFPQSLESKNIDAIGVTGDVEAQIRQFLELPAGGANSTLRVREVDSWVPPSGRPEFIPAQEWGFPPLNEMPMEDIARVYRMKQEPLIIAVTVAKGCPYQCSFCCTPNIEGAPDRRREVGEVVDFIAGNPQYDSWQFYAPTFTLNRAWCMDLFEELQARDVDIRWKCTTRVDKIDDELLRGMASSGCEMIGLGVEALGEREGLNKGIHDSQIVASIEMIRSHGIVPKAYVMVGLPGQSIDDVSFTIDTLKGLGASIRPTLYSNQGEADSLGEEVGNALANAYDKKSYTSDKANYGAYLNLAFGYFKGVDVPGEEVSDFTGILTR